MREDNTFEAKWKKVLNAAKEHNAVPVISEDGICIGCGEKIIGAYSASILKNVEITVEDREYQAALILLCYDCTLEQNGEQIKINLETYLKEHYDVYTDNGEDE